MERATKQEVVKRMRLLQLSPSCISAFKKGEVWESEFGGVLYQCDATMQDLISQVQDKYDCLVYHVIKDICVYGDEKMNLISFLFVSKHKEEWSSEWKDMKNGIVFGYVYNETYPDFSELGPFYVVPSFGGLERTNAPHKL